MVGRSPAAARQLASRARRRVQGASSRPRPRPGSGSAKWSTPSSPPPAAATSTRLVALLDPDVVLTADQTAADLGTARELHGAHEVATFSRYARGATPTLLDGAAALVWIVDGSPRVVYRFASDEDRITGIDLIADPARLRDLNLVIGSPGETMPR